MWCLQLSALKRKKNFFGGKATFRKNRIERKKIQVKKKREGERERVKSVREKEEEYFFFWKNTQILRARREIIKKII